MLTFENHCLEGRLTFGDPFQDSGVVWSKRAPNLLQNLRDASSGGGWKWTHGAERSTPSLAGTNPGTGTAYLPTALPTAGPYALPVPGLEPGQRRWADDSEVDEGGQGHKILGGCLSVSGVQASPS